MPPFATTTLMLVPLAIVGLPDSTRREKTSSCGTPLATGCSMATSQQGHPFDLENSQRSQLPFNLPAGEVKRIANAIYLAEGGKATRYPYGVKSVTIASTAEAERVCWNTINHNWREFFLKECKTRNAKHFAGRSVVDGEVPREFIDFLADHYCPASCDKQGNQNWKKNVWFFLRTGREEKNERNPS